MLRSQKRIDLSLAAGADTSFKFSDLPTVSGYTRLLATSTISGTMSSFMNHYQTGFVADATVIRAKNLSTQAFSGTIEVTCLYVKDGFFEEQRTGM